MVANCKSMRTYITVPGDPDAVNLIYKAVYLPALLQEAFGNSGSHWRRQIDQGGVKVAGEAVAAYEVPGSQLDGAVVQAGKRQFVRVHLV